MKINTFTTYLEKISATSKRLEKTSLLADLYGNLEVEEVQAAVYMSLGYVTPPFVAENKTNIADKMMTRAIQKIFPNTKDIEQMYKKSGDLGDTVYELFSTQNASANQTDQRLTDVYAQLQNLVEASGEGSQEAKVDIVARLLAGCSPLSAKYLTRIILNNTRLGFTELTWIDAFAVALGNKQLADNIEAKYNTHPDLGLIAKKLKTSGVEGLADVKIEPGIPVLSQRAQRAGNAQEIMDRIGSGWAEFKLDGTRVQLHYKKTGKNILVRTFTRNLEETTHQFPEIIQDFMQQAQFDSIIVDGEAIGYDRQSGDFLDFQQTIKRKRKHGVAEIAEEIPLKYYIFDILYLNGKETIDLPLNERHKLLKDHITKSEHVVVTEHIEARTVEELEEYFTVSREKNLEGLIIKQPEDPYQAGARSYSWIKLKNADEKLLEDSVDCVVLGYYYGKGERTKFGIGGFLMGIFDEEEERFKTLTKLGTGLKDEDFRELKMLCDKYATTEKPAEIDVSKLYTPDVWLNPRLVLEISGDEISTSSTHSSGYAMRFPRLIKVRNDKNAINSTTVKEIRDLQSRQKTQRN